MSRIDTEFNLEYPENKNFVSDEDIYKNNKNIRDLISLFSSVNNNDPLLLFAGAGISILLGYDSWSSIVSDLKKQFCEDYPSKKQDLEKIELDSEKKFKNLELVQFIKEEMDFNKYKVFLKSKFLNKKFDSIEDKTAIDIIKKLVVLPVSGFITSNYENTLAQAVDTYNNTNRVLTDTVINCHYSTDKIDEFENSIKNNEKKVLYIHGTSDTATTIVLATEDYRKAYNLIEIPKLHHRVDQINKIILEIGKLLNNYIVIFIGFSFDDIAARTILELNFKRKFDYKNYAIMGYSSYIEFKKIQELEDEYGLKIINYYVPTNDDQKDFKTNLNKLLDVIYKKPEIIKDKTGIESNEIQTPNMINTDILDIAKSNFIEQYSNLQNLKDLFNQESDDNNNEN